MIGIVALDHHFQEGVVVAAVRIGVQLASLRFPFKKALHTVASWGVSAIEIDARTDLRPTEITGSALRQVRKLLDDLGLRVVAVRFRTRHGYDEPEKLDARVGATKQAMKLAFDLGANVLVNQVGVVESSQESTSPLLKSVLEDLGKFGEHIGVWLGCETGSEPLTHLVSLVESLPETMIGITLNPGNLLVNGFDLTGLREAACHVRLVHAKDGVRDRARGRGTEVPLGRGLAEFPEIAAILEERQFPGYFVIERDEAVDPVFEVSQGVQFLRNL